MRGLREEVEASAVPRDEVARLRGAGSIRLGRLRVDQLTMDQALDAIESLLSSGLGGAVFTPNVDHVVQVERDAELRGAYARAELSLADGMPLLWASRLLRTPLPARVSGSDLFEPLMKRAAQRGYRVFLLGGAPGVAAAAREKLSRQLGVRVVGASGPQLPVSPRARWLLPLTEELQRAQPDLVIVAMGAPKQELWIDALKESLRPAVMLGLGATLDFYVGQARRPPVWMRKLGLEWLGRLLMEPMRLWKRYLVRDPKFLRLVLRQLRAPRNLPASVH